MPSLLDNVFIVPLVITYLLFIALSFRFLKRLKADKIRHPKESTRDGVTLQNRKPLPALSTLLLTYWWVICSSAIFYCSIWKVKCLVSNVWLFWSVPRQYKNCFKRRGLSLLAKDTEFTHILVFQTHIETMWPRACIANTPTLPFLLSWERGGAFHGGATGFPEKRS